MNTQRAIDEGSAQGYPDAYRSVMQSLTEQVKMHYAGRLRSFVIFGSVARGTQRPDSDIDCLIVADDLPKGRFKRVKVRDVLLPDEGYSDIIHRGSHIFRRHWHDRRRHSAPPA